MKIQVMTLFPEVFESLNSSILQKAMEKGLLSVQTVNIRAYTLDKHGKVDDYPYGGGAGMLMQAQPIYDAYQAICSPNGGKKIRTLYMTPQGRPFSQKLAQELAAEEELIFLCGHYEGVDERVLEEIVTDEISIGDYVLTGGELPAMVMIDAIARLLPGVLHNAVSAQTESFDRDLLEYPQYSRPEIWMGKAVPEVLLCGDHKKINAWRLEQAEKKTREKRPDLYQKYLHHQEWIGRLKKKKRKMIHLMETLREGRGELLWEAEDPMGILLYNPSGKEIYAEGVLTKEAEELLKTFSERESVTLITAQRELTLKIDGESPAENTGRYPVCYTRRETLPLRYKECREYEKEGCPFGFSYYEGEEPVGYACGKYPGRIDEIFVKEAYRRRGIGSSLAACCVNAGLAADCTTYAFADKQSLPFWHNLGFLSDEEKKICVALGKSQIGLA